MVLGCDRRPCGPRTVAFWLGRSGGLCGPDRLGGWFWLGVPDRLGGWVWLGVPDRLDRWFWPGGLSIGFDVGSPGPIGRGLLVDHAELLPPSRSAISGFLGRPLGASEDRRSEETLPALGVSRSFASADWVSMETSCLPSFRPEGLPHR